MASAGTHHTSSFTKQTTIGMGKPGRGFLRGHITAIGDSVMVDYQHLLAKDLPGVAIHATVGMQWYTGRAELATLRAHDRLGAIVIVALGTNGPISTTLMSEMLKTLKGASRIIFVTNHVDRPWQNPNNALLEKTAIAHPHIVIANWYARSKAHPAWFYADDTHLPIDGVGASHLAWLIRQAVHRP